MRTAEHIYGLQAEIDGCLNEMVRQFKPLEEENYRLKAIFCRQVCDCDKDWQSDSEALDLTNHNPHCVWAECVKEAQRP